jgi:hypothetical protein
MAGFYSPSRSLGQAKIISASPQKPVSGPQSGPGNSTSRQVFLFQFWPESLSDSKTVEYSTKAVPGGSHPLYQWVRGGERILSFTAVFSRDLNPTQQFTTLNTRGQNVTPPVAKDKYNVDINAAVWALRRFLYPSYGGSDLKAFPPEVIQLQLDNTAIGGYDTEGPVDIMNCFMTRCDVQVQSWFPDGVPRFATVDLEFHETVQSDPREPADIRYVDRMKFAAAWNRYIERQGEIARAPTYGPNGGR